MVVSNHHHIFICVYAVVVMLLDGFLYTNESDLFMNDRICRWSE